MHELAITQSVVDMVVERTAGRRVGLVRLPSAHYQAWCPMRWSFATSSSLPARRWRARPW